MKSPPGPSCSSFAIAPFVTACSLLLGGTAAYGVARLPSRPAAALQGLFVAPLIVPAAALAVALFLLLDELRLTDTIAGVVIGHIVATLPYTFRTLLVALKAADRALEEAALSLGASRLAVVRRVTLPLIRPALVASTLFALIISIDEFTLTWFISGRSIHTIPLEIFQQHAVRHGPNGRRRLDGADRGRCLRDRAAGEDGRAKDRVCSSHVTTR